MYPVRCLFASRWEKAALLICAGLAWGCSGGSESGGSGLAAGASTDGGTGGTPAGAGGSSGASSSGSSGAGGASAAGGATLTGDAGALALDLCGGAGCACSNGKDDDGDGKIDGLDEECTGPFDNDEGSFATGIPGDNRDPIWQDCFFDGNSGAGDDKCRYHTECLTGERDSSDPSCQVSDACRNFCQARTPNGCDCFGCCTVSTPSGSVNVVIGGECSLENIDDESVCQRCEPTEQCGNECGECELCPGKSVEDLPDSCLPEAPPDEAPEGGVVTPPPSYTCDNGEEVCTDTSDCSESNYYCQLGCCLPVIR